MKNFPENRLKQLRMEKGWTQKDLAENSGVKLTTIQKLEIRYNNIEKAQFNTLHGLAQTFETDIEYLVGVRDINLLEYYHKTLPLLEKVAEEIKDTELGMQIKDCINKYKE